MSESPTPVPGRRASVVSRRRVDLLVALGIVLPAVVAVSLGVIGDEDDPLAGVRPPTTAALTSATVVCPAAAVEADGAGVTVTRAPGVPGGEVAVRTEGDAGVLGDGAPVEVATGASVVLTTDQGATTLDARGDSAPGLVAGRADALAVPECRAPSYDEWLVGVGASARYATTLELVNADEGDAVVDVELFDAAGPVEEPALRGVQVPARGVKRIDLAEVAPRAAVTAAHLTTVRGRVTATARTTLDPLGRGRATTDFLPADQTPATMSLILGVPDDARGPLLYLVNPGDDEVRVTTRLVTPEAVFTPTGAKEVAVGPHSLQTVRLGRILAADTAEGVVGLQIESTGPVASSVRLTVKRDLVLLAPAIELDEPTAAVVPPGAKTLLLGGATRSGVVHVASYDAAGKELADDRVEVGADSAASLALPPGAVSLTLEARNTRISAVVSIPATGRDPGLAVLRVRPVELTSRVPVVQPQ